MGESVPFATVSRAQGGMVFAAYKRGDLDATDQQMKMMYTRYVRDKYESAKPTDDSKSIDVAAKLRNTINALSANDYRAANYLFQKFLDAHHSTYSEMRFPDDRKK